MDEIISYKMSAVKVRNAKLRNYLKGLILPVKNIYIIRDWPICLSSMYSKMSLRANTLSLMSKIIWC
jgi:hypothetical protein